MTLPGYWGACYDAARVISNSYQYREGGDLGVYGYRSFLDLSDYELTYFRKYNLDKIRVFCINMIFRILFVCSIPDLVILV
jgi:hypothetical protein